MPRTFVPGASAEGAIELPQAELDKLRKVLRLGTGDELAILPNDGTLIRCTLQGREAVPVSVERPNTENPHRLLLAQALPKPDRLDAVVRQCTEVGVAGFIGFSSDRSVAKWDPKKVAERLRRLGAIAQEAAEQSYRTIIPTVEWMSGLDELLKTYPEALVLSEGEEVTRRLDPQSPAQVLVIGPEGGWSPRERQTIGDRAVTLGPLVFRVDTAAVVAASLTLLRS